MSRYPPATPQIIERFPFQCPTSGAIMSGFAGNCEVDLLPLAGQVMWMDKLADGVLQVDTAIGPRYVRLNFKQRAYLMWMFRNFQSLPHQVLSQREQRFVERLCEENGFASIPGLGTANAPVIGRIEKRMPSHAELLPMRKPMVSTKAPVAEQSREAASA